jgi:protein-S-isoprenylcysteine O-methyltransferase Ste14
MLKNRVPPPVLALGSGALMWWVDRHVPLLRLFGPPWTRIGWIFIAAGVLVDAVSVAAFIRAKTTVNPIRVDRASRLVVSGLYRLSRNPMYLGLMTVLAGWAVLLGSLGPWLMLLVFERLILTFQIRAEEAALEAKFGDDYVQYTRRVNRWFGRVSP